MSTAQIPLGYCQCGCGGIPRIAPYNDRTRGWVKGQHISFVPGHNAAGRKKPHQTKHCPACGIVFKKTSPSRTANGTYCSFACSVVPAGLHRRKEMYVVDPESGCWIWILSTNQHGYARLRRNGKTQLAHRFFGEQKNGPIPAKKQLDHMCHNADRSCAGGPLCRHRRCVNPDHLEPATNVENSRRGRNPRLTIEQVREIRNSTESHRILAARFSVEHGHIGHIKRGEIWAE